MATSERPDEFNSDGAASAKRTQAPYSNRHPVPTTQRYKQVRQERQQLDQQNDEPHEGGKGSGLKKLIPGFEDSNDNDEAQGWAKQGYNRNIAALNMHNEAAGQREMNGNPKDDDDGGQDSDAKEDGEEQDSAQDDDEQPVDTSEAVSNGTDPRRKRKAMKGRAPEKDSKSRTVTDPITHLPVTIHDFTSKELQQAPENPAAFGSRPKTRTNSS